MEALVRKTRQFTENKILIEDRRRNVEKDSFYFSVPTRS